MDDKIKKSLFDIKTAIHAISLHTINCNNFPDYQKSLTVKRAVERELEIIGEAVNRILKIDADFNLKHARRIVDLRNLIIHGYDGIDDEMIWSIIQRHIPELQKEIQDLIFI